MYLKQEKVYQLNVRNEQGEIFDFKDAEDEINGVVSEYDE